MILPPVIFIRKKINFLIHSIHNVCGLYLDQIHYVFNEHKTYFFVYKCDRREHSLRPITTTFMKTQKLNSDNISMENTLLCNTSAKSYNAKQYIFLRYLFIIKENVNKCF